MPLWQVFHPSGTFTTPESKSALVKSITKIYTDGPHQLPPFYVNVFFIPLDPANMFLSGEPILSRTDARPFIRFVVEHIAVRQPDKEAAYTNVRERLNDAVKPHIDEKGYDWEFHVDETERRLWKINGQVPPELGTEGQQIWYRENRPVPLTDEQRVKRIEKL